MSQGGYTPLGRRDYGSTTSKSNGEEVPKPYTHRQKTKRGLSDIQQIGSQSSENILQPLEVIDPGIWTFRVCLIGLTFMWLTGIGVIVYGAVAQSISDRSEDGYAPSYVHHKAVVPFVQLAVSFWVTALSDIAGLVHSTSLRFTLLASRKLTFNSNLRLFTSCPKSRVHWWPINFIWAWSLISSYACGSMVLVESVYSSADSGRDMVSGYALIFLGFGLLGQASIASWALMVTKIPTWSTNPIHTAKVCQTQGWLASLSGRTMMSVHDAQHLEEHETPSLPKARQKSLLKAHFRVRRVLVLVWVVTLLGFLWFAAISIAYQVGGGPGHLGPTWGSFSRSYTNDWSLIPNWKDYTAFLGISTSLGQSFYTFGPWLVCKYLLTCAILGGITMNLHVVELLVQCSRDESLWRETSSTSGLGPRRYGAFSIAFLTWQTMTLFVFKTVIHWIFSLAFGIYYEGIEIRIPQVCFTANVLFALALLATLLALQQPKGPQPATFGHLPTLVDLIDLWPCRSIEETEQTQSAAEDGVEGRQDTDMVTLYWGDKGEDQNGIRRAGTSYTPLGPIVMSALYL
ncbi:hypothetical protein H2200_013575 [Cladophialophora chaetospira]|uniref:Uncharacterized protein n=1 Tax=Cladophialophora chaetospira TaxID=386627 RepID=A0AA38U8Q7_9EURO|nr:hypothetical protein H2200_013575 [Cladophialophora chaetospira]